MITIRVDDCLAFDMLSIFHIKIKKNPENPSHVNGYNWLFNDISACIGTEKTWQIISSEEFKRLVDANEKVYDLVDKVKDDSVKGSVVDAANFERYKCKQVLQESFFNSKQLEKKIGY